MPLSVPFLFHFNQHFNEYARVAGRACYRGLLRVLRAHPALKFNLHISGTLIHALSWVDPEPLELIRDGLKAGQFELLGSTYAQNILYASNDWDNARQIELHKAALSDTFGVEPRTFWNVERCWRQSLVPLMAEAGYNCTLVEDHILSRAGAAGPFTFTTRADSHRLMVVTDDETLKHKVNLAAWFGRSGQAFDHLRALAARPDADTLCPAYAEDAEAMGLWGWERGVTPNQTWAYLDEFLSALEAEPGLRLIHFSDAPPPGGDLTPIPDGSAAWMDAALTRPDAPYHEDGYANWFDFHHRSPKLKHFTQTYDIIRARIQAMPQSTPGAEAFRRAALLTYCAHQYEFGCIGVGGLNDRGWEDARTAVAVARAAQVAEADGEFVIIDDCNGDGSDEVLVSDGTQLQITTAYGGRVLYWFDLRTGQQFLGNQLPVLPGVYTGDGHFPVVEPVNNGRLPEDDAPRHSAERVEEMPPTRMGRFLPLWVWQSESLPVAVAAREMNPGEAVMPLMAQTRAFADYVTLDTQSAEQPPEEWLDSRMEKGGVTFIRYLSDELTLEKTLRFVLGKLVAGYTLRNHDRKERSLRLRVTSELCPDYMDVVRYGRGALQFVNNAAGDAPGVQNTRTQTTLALGSTRSWQALEQRVDFCALTLGLTFDVTLGPRSEQRFELRLKRTPKN
ncbi:MAG: hypothetical protein HY872_12220 [Chloroflexi bacterium]|nr:hypothetical protein [Chloroflexota bacterium]